ncbi:MAG TPA: MipA/OmpV family protein [Paucimonas sp.]|nr:MipA/OmpV family protein [Paucimonas sp.]
MRVSAFMWCLLAATTSVEANTLFPTLETDNDARFGIGLGMLAEDEGYRGIGTEVEPVPVLYVQTERLRILGPQLTYRLAGDAASNIGLRLDYRLDGFDADDGEVFRGMDKRTGSAALGVAGQFATAFGDLHYSVAKAAAASKGVYGTVQMAWPLRGGAWTVTPRAGFEYFDRKFTDYYFGVRAHEVRADRRGYTPSASVNLDAGIDIQRSFGAQHVVLASIKYRKFGKDIQDSPLIGKSGSPRFNIGYLYRF